MTGLHRRPARWPDVAIVLATIALGLVAIRWADREYVRILASQGRLSRSASRPDWVWELRDPYQRLQQGWNYAAAATTIGVAALLARDGRARTRRGRSRPGTSVVLVALLVGGTTVAHQLLAGRPFIIGEPKQASLDVGNALIYWIPGAVVGARIVARLGRRRRHRPDDWRERLGQLVGWLWLGLAGLMIVYGLIFG